MRVPLLRHLAAALLKRSRLLTGIGALVLFLACSPAAGAANRVKSTTCDDVDPRYCLLPWPNNHFTAYNIDTETRRQVRLPAAMPANVGGKPIARFPYTLSDGFSPGGPFLTYVPGLDLKRTGAAPITDLRSYTDRTAPIVVIDAATLKRQPIWAELDAGAPRNSERLLLIHPAKNLVEGRRYIVALRRMRGANGAAAEAEPSVRAPALRPRAHRALRQDVPHAAPRRHRSARRSTWPGTSAPPASATSPSA